MGLRMPEILLIFGALLLLFGASRLPQLGSSLGSAIRNFKKGFTSDSEENKDKEVASLSDSSSTTPGEANKRASSREG